MKKRWFTADAFFCAFLSAIGYGLGYSIPCVLGKSNAVCLILCFAVGIAIEMLAENIMYSKFVQDKKYRKILVVLSFAVLFLIAHYVSLNLTNESLWDSLEEEFMWVIIFVVGGFAISLFRSYRRYYKVISKYGKGTDGFRFDSKEKEYIKSLNNRNSEITGEYDKTLSARTNTGIFVAEKDKNCLSFKGIPYAKPPIGSLRWKAPEKLENNSKVFEAKYFGPSSIQVNYDGNPLSNHNQSEDCLYLNVYTSELSPKNKKPVLVYFHGGDFTFGGSADPIWETESFVKEHGDVVAVTFNYRLGLLGYINFVDIPGGGKYKDASNLGLLDQIAALEWIKENISAFGGNPEQITVMGDGSGGISIGLLSICKRARGLFKNAVILSGNPQRAEYANSFSINLAEQLKKKTETSNMKDLMNLSEKEISRLTQELKGYMSLPKADGNLIPFDILSEYKKGTAKGIQFIISGSKDNVSAYGASIGRGLSESQLSIMIEKYIKDNKSEKKEELNKVLTEKIELLGKEKAVAEFVNEYIEQEGALQFANALFSGGNIVNLLYWDVESVIKNLGSGSVNIVSALLNNKEAALAYGSVINQTTQVVIQKLILKLLFGEELKLYNNEIDGIKEFKWEAFPKMLTIYKNKFQLEIADDVSDC